MSTSTKLTQQQLGVLASHLAWVQQNQPALFKAFVAKIVQAAQTHGLLPKSLVTTLSPTELIGTIVALSDLGVSIQNASAGGGISGLGQSTGSPSTFGDIATGLSSFLSGLATTYVGTRAALNTMNAQNTALANGYPASQVNAYGQPTGSTSMLSKVTSMSPVLIFGLAGVAGIGAIVLLKKKKRG